MTGKTREKHKVRYDVTRLSNDDVYLFHEGSHFRMYDKLGAHIMTAEDGATGVCLATWAPAAKKVAVVGDFNDWATDAHPLRRRDDSGLWEGFIPKISPGSKYKFYIEGKKKKQRAYKSDPYGRYHELSPKTASIVWPLDFTWQDDDWMSNRRNRHDYRAPVAIYEVHLGSWMRAQDGKRFLTYRELAPGLAEYVRDMGFTHVEFLPVMEHPFYGSWGYQCTGYFAPTSRYGTPQDLMYLIDYLHRHNIGVILDWAPAHFPDDEHGLGLFDGSHLYEHPDPRRGFNPEWNSYVFDFGRPEVQSFLLSSAFFWLEKYHADGLRVDAVSSMLHLDYARDEGEWLPNEHGGNENLEAIAFLRRLNTEIYAHFPDIQMFAEEATAWPMVSHPTYVGGLGFGYKWDMGWMHDTLAYLEQDPVHRKSYHNKITFRAVYAFNENYILPLSHDEVGPGKDSLLEKMPGDDWQKVANVRALLGNHYMQPGKKLLFMGNEFAQRNAWTHDGPLDWDLLSSPQHLGIQKWVQDLNRFYAQEPAMHELDNNPNGFEWVDCLDNENSVISFLRKDASARDFILVVFNFMPVAHENYRLGVPRAGMWQESLNSDAKTYGGSGLGNFGGRAAEHTPLHHHPYSLNLLLPPLSCLVLKNSRS